jgi:hypothetical protein
MDTALIKARYDWLVELGGAAAAGLAAGFAALKLAPTLGLAPGPAMIAGASAMAGLALLVMRAVPADPRNHALAGFAVEPIDTVAGEPLLLDDVHEEPLLLEDVAGALAEEGELLLDDPLVADPDSRVVHLFASPPLPTPGELKQRIDRHLAESGKPGSGNVLALAPDASDALYAALAELRRSLR